MIFNKEHWVIATSLLFFQPLQKSHNEFKNFSLVKKSMITGSLV